MSTFPGTDYIIDENMMSTAVYINANYASAKLRDVVTNSTVDGTYSGGEWFTFFRRNEADIQDILMNVLDTRIDFDVLISIIKSIPERYINKISLLYLEIISTLKYILIFKLLKLAEMHESHNEPIEDIKKLAEKVMRI